MQVVPSIFNFTLASVLIAVLGCAGRAAAQCSAADINHNGVVEGGDLGMLLDVWGTNNADADINNDGVVDAVDLAELLGAWGPCNDMFNQPTTNNDNTCGIRQTLIAKKVLTNNADFYGDILAMWQLIYAQTQLNYPAGLPVSELDQYFLISPPTVYTPAGVKAANGGPRTPPSSILNVLKATGYRMERYYIDQDEMDQHFTSAFVDAELAIFATAFPDAESQVVDAAASPASLRSLFTNEGSYYIVVVNDGNHWIGVTADTIYNSLGTAPVKNSSDFGQLDGNPNETETNTFTGLVIEIRKN